MEEFALKILPFFEKIEINNPKSLDFCKKRFVHTMRDFCDGICHRMSLEEVIKCGIEFVNDNPHKYKVNNDDKK